MHHWKMDETTLCILVTPAALLQDVITELGLKLHRRMSDRNYCIFHYRNLESHSPVLHFWSCIFDRPVLEVFLTKMRYTNPHFDI